MLRKILRQLDKDVFFPKKAEKPLHYLLQK